VQFLIILVKLRSWKERREKKVATMTRRLLLKRVKMNEI
jgi:hypothetical protein